MEVFDKLLLELKDYKLIVGILIGIFGYMSIEIKSYLDDYIKSSIEFNILAEKAYLNLRFNNSSFNEALKNFDMDNPCIPKYFKYAILKQDFLAIESILVLNYSKTNDDNYMIIYNGNRFILLALLLVLTFIFIIIFFTVVGSVIFIPLFGLLVGYISKDIFFFITTLLSILVYILFFTKIFDFITDCYFKSSYNSFSAIENEQNYENTLKVFKEKYKILCKKGYKLRLNIYQDDFNI